MPPSAALPTICFFHVQKCGGTSVRRAIRDAFVPRSDDDVVVELDAPAATRQAERLGIHNLLFRDQLLAYFLDSHHSRAIMGHFRYTESDHAAHLEQNRFVTVLRRPADRLLSAYFYDRYKDDDHGRMTTGLHDFLLDAKGEPTLRGRVHAERFIAMFRGDGTTGARRATPADIDAATRNLERFACVGFLEEMQPFVDQIEKWADGPVEIPVVNRTPASDAQRAELTDELREVVEEICRPAQIVYDRLREHTLG